MQSLPLILLMGVGLALVGTRLLQTVQSRVFHVVPFGLMSKFSIEDTCVGMLVSGMFMLYFGTCTQEVFPASLTNIKTCVYR